VELSKHWKVVASVVDIGGDNDQPLVWKALADALVRRLCFVCNHAKRISEIIK